MMQSKATARARKKEKTTASDVPSSDPQKRKTPKLPAWLVAAAVLGLLAATMTARSIFTSSGGGGGAKMVLPAFRPALEPRLKFTPTEPVYLKAAVPRLTGVYITPVLSDEECEWIIGIAENLNDWRARLSYDTREVNVLDQLPELVDWMRQPSGVQDRLFEVMRRQFKLPANARITVDNSNIIRYDNSLGTESNHVIMHADGSLFTFNVALTNPKLFGGGGTGMMALNDTIWPRRGEAITYYGNMYHSGEPVSSGRRYIWQAFCRLEGGETDESIAEVPLEETKMQVEWAEHALAMHPGLYDAWFSAGNLMRKLGRTAESAPYLERALETGHRDKLLLYGKLAEAHSMNNDLQSTRKFMKKVLELDPGDEHTAENLKMLNEHLGPERR